MPTILSNLEQERFIKAKKQIKAARMILLTILNSAFIIATICLLAVIGLAIYNEKPIMILIMVIAYGFMVFLYTYQMYWELKKNQRYYNFINKSSYKDFSKTWTYHYNFVAKHFQFMLIVTTFLAMIAIAISGVIIVFSALH